MKNKHKYQWGWIIVQVNKNKNEMAVTPAPANNIKYYGITGYGEMFSSRRQAKEIVEQLNFKKGTLQVRRAYLCWISGK